jgi:molecular chaperone GrpE
MSERPTDDQAPHDEDAARHGANETDDADLPHAVGGVQSDPSALGDAATPADDRGVEGAGYEDVTAASTASQRDVESRLGAAAPPAGEGEGDRTERRQNEDLRETLARVEAERDQYLDDLQRARAEFQNYRRRTEREGGQRREQGRADVLRQLLDVLDEFELAVMAADSASDVASVRHGVEMVYGKLIDVLRSFGLEKIGREGVPFDPERHDAVQQVDASEVDVEPADGQPVVAEVLRPGYMVGERVIRPAMVKVAS